MAVVDAQFADGGVHTLTATRSLRERILLPCAGRAVHHGLGKPWPPVGVGSEWGNLFLAARPALALQRPGADDKRWILREKRAVELESRRGEDRKRRRERKRSRYQVMSCALPSRDSTRRRQQPLPRLQTPVAPRFHAGCRSSPQYTPPSSASRRMDPVLPPNTPAGLAYTPGFVLHPESQIRPIGLISPKKNGVIRSTVAGQMQDCLSNVADALAAHGLNAKLVKVTRLMTDVRDV